VFCGVVTKGLHGFSALCELVPERVAQWPGQRYASNSSASVVIFSDVPIPGTLDLGSSKFVTVGSMRLDQPIGEFSAQKSAGGETQDDAFVVAELCQKYGEDFPAHLEGDFGFAVWDESACTLVLATDRFSTHPIFYRLTREKLFFADEPALIAGGLKPVISERDVAEFILGKSSSEVATHFPNVEILSPATMLAWSPVSLSQRSYWSLDLREPTQGDEEAEFRSLFEAAVERRLRPGRTAALLSGGLDSTSITMTADRLLKENSAPPLTTVSLIYPDYPDLDESRYINAALALGTMSPVLLDVANADPLAGVAETQRGLGRLSVGSSPMRRRRLMRAAHDHGCSVVLDGHGGDEVVSYGFEHVVALIKAGRFLEAIPLVRTYSRLWNDDFVVLVDQLARLAPRTVATRVLRRFLRTVNRERADAKAEISQYLNSDFVARSGVKDPGKSENAWDVGELDFAREVHRNVVLSTRSVHALQSLNWKAQQEGVEVRFPFFDRALVEFCVNLPGEHKIRHNETRSILRRALSDVLPTEVRKRQDKAEFQGELAGGLVLHHSERLEALKVGSPRLARIVNQDVVAAAADNVLRLGRKAASLDSAIIWRLLHLDVMLHENSDVFDLQF
jgi:asparagine synthase (glutamine-hydrolysing)